MAAHLKIFIAILFIAACLVGIVAVSGVNVFGGSEVDRSRAISNAWILKEKVLAAVKANGNRFPSEFRTTEDLARFIGVAAGAEVLLGTEIKRKARFVPNPYLSGMKMDEVHKPELMWMLMERPGREDGWRYVVFVDGRVISF